MQPQRFSHNCSALLPLCAIASACCLWRRNPRPSSRSHRLWGIQYSAVSDRSESQSVEPPVPAAAEQAWVYHAVLHRIGMAAWSKALESRGIVSKASLCCSMLTMSQVQGPTVMNYHEMHLFILVSSCFLNVFSHVCCVHLVFESFQFPSRHAPASSLHTSSRRCRWTSYNSSSWTARIGHGSMELLRDHGMVMDNHHCWGANTLAGTIDIATSTGRPWPSLDGLRPSGVEKFPVSCCQQKERWKGPQTEISR